MTKATTKRKSVANQPDNQINDNVVEKSTETEMIDTEEKTVSEPAAIDVEENTVLEPVIDDKETIVKVIDIGDSDTQVETPIIHHDDNQKDEPLSDMISVTNNASYNLFEPATHTLLKAKTIAYISLKKVSKERVLKNINQLNYLHGNCLVIGDKHDSI